MTEEERREQRWAVRGLRWSLSAILGIAGGMLFNAALPPATTPWWVSLVAFAVLVAAHVELQRAISDHLRNLGAPEDVL